MKRLVILALVALVLLIGVPVAASPGDLYVDDDDPTCGGNSPCYSTIQSAINDAVSGDTINVAAGTYDEYLVIQKSIHLMGEDKDTTILTYTGASTREQLIMLGWNTGGTLAGGATVQGFKLVGGVGLDGDKDLIKLRANAAPGAPIVIKDNVFQGDGTTRYLGIETAYDAGYVTVENNEFYDLAYGAWFNVLTNAEIRGNTIADAIYTALALCTSDVDVIHDVDIVDNTILRAGTAQHGSVWSSGMHIGSTVYNMNISCNTIVDGYDYGIVIHDRGSTYLSNVHINFNNMYNNPDGFLNEVGVVVNAENNWWGATDGPSGAGSGSGDAVSTNVDFDPWLAAEIGDVCPPVADDEGPVISNVVADPVPIGSPGAVTATVDDSQTGGSTIDSAEYNIDGGSWTGMNAVDTSFDEVSEDVEATIPAFTETGVHDVCVRGTDAADNLGDPECTLLAVYDPTAGFVTGGGWIDSPEGAYAPDPALTGKANFGFVSKYKKGADVPTGNTEFQFQAGDLKFHSTSYDWLVVTGSDYAKFKGVGTINGVGNYKFKLWAGDDDPDTFRIKIWWEEDDTENVIYDNGMDQPIGGGSIVVHTKKK